MSEHFKAAGFKMRRMSALDEKIEKQEKANQVLYSAYKLFLTVIKGVYAFAENVAGQT